MYNITFEKVTKLSLNIALEIINSNPNYNMIENGSKYRIVEDIQEEFINNKTVSLFIKSDDTYIGLIDFLQKNPNDGMPWIGLFMIHGYYHHFGFGTSAYIQFEQWALKNDQHLVRLGIIKENKPAQNFWKSHGYHYIKSVYSPNSKPIDIYEKSI